jgi:ribosomal protein S18 acetylase RimI-like enzyme
LPLVDYLRFFTRPAILIGESIMQHRDRPASQLPDACVVLDAREKPISAVQFGDVFARSGIRRPATDLPRLQKMLEHGNLLLGAWKDGQLIGVARGLTDFVFCCYLSDLAVDRAYQKMGIGKALLAHVQARLSDQVTTILLAAPTARDYYKPLGFEWAENAWLIPRRR